MIQSSALKRMRRTMWNLERQFLNPLIKKSMWRLMQFNAKRYPQDMEFVVKGSMGIVSREFEQTNLTNLLAVVPPESPASPVILTGIVELSGSHKRDELLAAIKAAFEPKPEELEQAKLDQQLSNEGAKAGIRVDTTKAQKTEAEIRLIDAKTAHENINAQLEDEKIDIQAANTVIGREKAKAAHEANKVNREKIKVDARKATASKG